MPAEPTGSFFADPGALASNGAGCERRGLFEGAEISTTVIAGPPAEVALHLHRVHDEFGYLIAGSGQLRIGDQAHELVPGSAWGIVRGTAHSATFTSAYRLLSWFAPADDPATPDRIELGPA